MPPPAGTAVPLPRFPRDTKIPMKYALGLTAAVALILAAQIDRPAAQTNSQPANQLSEQEKAVVIRAAVEAKSHQKTPKDFAPASERQCRGQCTSTASSPTSPAKCRRSSNTG